MLYIKIKNILTVWQQMIFSKNNETWKLFQPETCQVFAKISLWWFMPGVIETLCRKIFVNVCKISQIKTHINLTACIFMTQNKGCNATFDKDNKLQTQQCMNIIITRTIYVSLGKIFRHTNLMSDSAVICCFCTGITLHLPIAKQVGWLHAW